jgi:hypothetical protein
MSGKINRPLAAFVKIPQESVDGLVDQIIELSSRDYIRATEDGKYSVFDIVSVVMGKGNPRDAWKHLSSRYPDTVEKCDSVSLPRSDGKKANMASPVGDLATIIEIIWLLPGDFSAKFRKLGADIVSQVVEQQVSADDKVIEPDADAVARLMASVADLQRDMSDLKANQVALPQPAAQLPPTDVRFVSFVSALKDFQNLTGARLDDPTYSQCVKDAGRNILIPDPEQARKAKDEELDRMIREYYPKLSGRPLS